jgi:hypothetical protein
VKALHGWAERTRTLKLHFQQAIEISREYSLNYAAEESPNEHRRYRTRAPKAFWVQQQAKIDSRVRNLSLSGKGLLFKPILGAAFRGTISRLLR